MMSCILPMTYILKMMQNLYWVESYLPWEFEIIIPLQVLPQTVQIAGPED